MSKEQANSKDLEYICSEVKFEKKECLYLYDYPYYYRWAILITTWFAMCILGPPFMNWPPLRDMFGAAGAFNSVCDNSLNVQNVTCEVKSIKLDNLGGTCSAVYFMSIILCGMILDTLGAKYTSIIGLSVTALGWIIIGVSGPNFDHFRTGILLVALSIDCAFMGLLSVSNLFPGYSSTLVALMGTARSLSFAVPLLMKEVYKKFSIMVVSFSFCIVLAIVACYVALFIPVRQYPKIVFQSDIVDGETAVPSLKQHIRHPSRNIDAGWKSILTSQKNFFIKYMIDLPYLAFVVVLSVAILRNTYYIETSRLHLLEAEPFYAIMSPLSFIPCPFLGLLVDKVSPILTCGLIAFCGVASLGLTMIKWSSTRYCSVLFNWVYISFIASQCYCYISFTYPQSELGRLAGFSFLVAGLVSLSTNAMSIYAKVSLSNLIIMDTIVMALGIFAICITLFLFYFVELKKKKKLKNNLEIC